MKQFILKDNERKKKNGRKILEEQLNEMFYQAHSLGFFSTFFFFHY